MIRILIFLVILFAGVTNASALTEFVEGKNGKRFATGGLPPPTTQGNGCVKVLNASQYQKIKLIAHVTGFSQQFYGTSFNRFFITNDSCLRYVGGEQYSSDPENEMYAPEYRPDEIDPRTVIRIYWSSKVLTYQRLYALKEAIESNRQVLKSKDLHLLREIDMANIKSTEEYKLIKDKKIYQLVLEKPISEKRVKAQLDNDTDGDGLIDSIEIKLKLNPKNKDTDNDGYLDLEEILNSYNPNGKGRLSPKKAKSMRQLISKGKMTLLHCHRNCFYLIPRA